MEQLLHHLRNLGFTEIESKIMMDLAQHGPAGGYEVAKRLGASRSNVYAAMQRLERQGALQREAGEPIRYKALRPEDLTRLISERVEASLAFVEKELPRPEGEENAFLQMDGDQDVLELAAKRLGEARYEIVVDVWREEAALLRDELAAAERRGVRVLWACEGSEQGLSRTLAWPGWRGTQERKQGGRKFSFVIDRSWCMVGMRGGEMETTAMITAHPVMTELLLNQFSQEMVLFELEQDMGTELEARYGAHFDRIQKEYLSSEPEFHPGNEEPLRAAGGE
ncbi:TrmB family transcriptional regulator [Paenibacillus lemnae]|uniref:TrmB family transcriptional regulator n=1 Tax=Paenibacillus lemnae TaxID=1330551 RepID=A0A848MB59_PAELE|nr:TrmB family transcriptional regulator [Paenibacillus lemnae]NMO97302.1 TrmB family transcriptional regulator [Paenibacillus lemnae]